MTKLAAKLQTLSAEDRGATMVEYGLLVAFIALIALAGVKLLGTSLSGFFSDAGNQL